MEKKKKKTTQAIEQNIIESVCASGKMRSKDQYEVFAQVSDIIQQVHVEWSYL